MPHNLKDEVDVKIVMTHNADDEQNPVETRPDEDLERSEKGAALHTPRRRVVLDNTLLPEMLLSDSMTNVEAT